MKWQLEIDGKDHNNYVEIKIGYTSQAGNEHIASLRIMDDDVKHNPAYVVKMLSKLVSHANKVRSQNP